MDEKDLKMTKTTMIYNQRRAENWRATIQAPSPGPLFLRLLESWAPYAPDILQGYQADIKHLLLFFFFSTFT